MDLGQVTRRDMNKSHTFIPWHTIIETKTILQNLSMRLNLGPYKSTIYASQIKYAVYPEVHVIRTGTTAIFQCDIDYASC